MGRRRVGLDLDGVCYGWDEAVRGLLRRQFGHDLPVATRWYSHRDSVPKEHWDWLWIHGIEAGMFRTGPTYPGTEDAVSRIAERFDVVVITHRPRLAIRDTYFWLGTHRIPAREVHILSDDKPKSSIPCDAYIDDGPHVHADIRANRPEALALLWTRPWNEDYEAQAIRVASWDEVIRTLLLDPGMGRGL